MTTAELKARYAAFSASRATGGVATDIIVESNYGFDAGGIIVAEQTPESIAALAVQQSASSKTYAEQTAAALQAAGIQATVVVGQASGVGPGGYATVQSYMVQVGDYQYPITPDQADVQGNPGNTAAQIVSNLQFYGKLPMGAEPFLGGTGELAETPVAEAYGVSPKTPTGLQTSQSVTQSGSGQTTPTASGASGASTPSGGTVPTGSSDTGLVAELKAVMEQNGYSTTALYDGYEWSYFYQRTPSYQGYAIGPTEMGLDEGQKIGLVAAAGRIGAYLTSGTPTTGSAGAGGGAGVSLPAGWGKYALIGGGAVAGLLVLRALLK